MADLRLVDDRRVEQRPTAAGVGDGERPTGQVVGRDLVVAGAVGQVGDRPGEAGDVEVPRVLDDGDEQALLGVHGDGEVLLAVVDDLLAVDAGVDVRVGLQRLDRGEGEERQVAELDPLAGSNSLLALARSRATLVRSTSTTVVSWAETCSDSTIRVAMTLRSRVIFSRVPRLAETRSRRSAAPPAARRRWGGRAAAAAGAAAAAALAVSAASRTSCLRIRPPTPVPGQRAEVDAVLGGELAHQRGDVGAASSRGSARSAGAGVAGSRRCGRGRRRGRGRGSARGLFGFSRPGCCAGPAARGAGAGARRRRLLGLGFLRPVRLSCGRGRGSRRRRRHR